MAESCVQCPRVCGADRSRGRGFCGASEEIRLSRASLHRWEEPCISGERGSGTLFFNGCNLRCVFCQNREISHGEAAGVAVTEEELVEIMLQLQEEGAHNVNLVTPTPYALQLIPVLQKVRSRLKIPVVYNCGGYESVETLRALEGLVDVYLPDCKYYSPKLSELYSAAPDYFSVAMEALTEMLRQTGAPQMGEDGLLKKGVMVRHLVLPACREDSIEVLEQLCTRFGNRAFLLSLMSQYTPVFAAKDAPKSLQRRVTSFEYDKVLEKAVELDFQGYLQQRSSATADYTPNFSTEGVRTVTERISGKS